MMMMMLVMMTMIKYSSSSPSSSFTKSGGGAYRSRLTLQPDKLAPPAQIMDSLTVPPHQEELEQVLWSTEGMWACFSWADSGPPAGGGGEWL